MATLEKIRNRAGILVAIIIGLALIAFVLGDFLTKGNVFSGNQNEIAEVAGKSVPVQLYQKKVNEAIENYKNNSGQASVDESTVEMLRDEIWNQLIRDFIMEDEYKALGISVSTDEFNDMVTGNNIHPYIERNFKDPKTGQFDKNMVINYLNYVKEADRKTKAGWFAFANSIMQDRVTTKYNNLIIKGIFTTAQQAQKETTDKNLNVNFSYVVKKYNAVPDSLISVTESDINEYYENNKSKFEQETSRDIEYVTFDVAPSADDKNSTKEWIEDIAKEFAGIEDNAQYVNLNSDSPFNTKYLKKEGLTAPLDTLFDAEVGSIFGPYLAGDVYKVSKLVDAKNLPDSVKARHILIKIDEATPFDKAKAVVDSLKMLVENGTDFAELAEIHGTDGTKEKGGDLGWFTPEAMVQPFSDSCFFNKKGTLTTAITQFGIHLVEVTDRGAESKKVQVATVSRKIEAGSQTFDNFYLAANKFAGENNTAQQFDDAITEQGLVKRVANNLKEADKTIAGLESPRELIRWVYLAEQGDVSKVFEFGSRFVIAKLTAAREEGFAPVEQVKNEIEMNVKKDKKAEKLIEELKGATSIDELASNNNLRVEEATGINFQSFQIPGAGIEPQVIVAAVCLAKDEMSAPIKGANGVYVIKLNEVVQTEQDHTAEKNRIEREVSSRVTYQAFEALKENADITDNRSKFY